MTLMESVEAGHFSCHNYAGRNLHFGIREHGMAAICNGLSLCGLRVYGATFFVFTDYMRPSMRLASIMHQPVTYVLTHDSIGLGEDGPTHQPVEHLSACRAIPGLGRHPPRRRERSGRSLPHRHAAQAPSRHRPIAAKRPHARPDEIRTGLPHLPAVAILAEAPGGKPAAIIMATGSELDIAMKAWEKHG
jgi:transketolase